MNSIQDEFRKLIIQMDRDRLALAHRVNITQKAKEPTIEFLDMIARHPEYVADHQRPGVLVVPKDLIFTHAENVRTVQTSLLRANIIEHGDGSESPAYISIDYTALSQLYPELLDKTDRAKKLTNEFEQRRCPVTLVNVGDDEKLRGYMENVENVLVYFMARYGMDGRKLYRTADNEATMPRIDEKENAPYSPLKNVYRKALAFESFAGHGPDDEISFGVITRRMLPFFCNLIDLFYRHDEATQRTTLFTFPVLDIGKMRFINNGPGQGADYQRVTQSYGREIMKQQSVTTGEWLRHEMCEMLAGPMREMDIIPPDFLSRFFSTVDEVRTVVTQAGPFTPKNLSSVHQALIPRLH